MKNLFYFSFSFFFLISCSSKKTIIDNPNDDGLIEIVFLHVNDVYEIAPLPGDDKGGMARVATLKKQLLAKNKNTLAILPGDFVSPSVIGTLKDENGNRIKGAHMVDVMNEAGIDIVTFGNHEFDLGEEDLQKRIDESEFQWVSSNVLQNTKKRVKPFYKNKNEKRKKKEKIPETIIQTFTDEDGTSVTVGFFGVTLDVKQQSYLTYEDPIQRSKAMVKELDAEVDLIFPITHLEIEEDLKLAKAIPRFPLVMGGHDHNHMRFLVGSTVVAKADANAKTAYVHTVKYDTNEKTYTVYSELVTLDNNFALDPTVDKRVKYWTKIAENDMKKQGFLATEVVTILDDPLDGTESTVRSGQCPMGAMVVESIAYACDNKIDAAILNSGSIRIDDMLTGNMTQYDIIRILPYSGEIIEVEMTGVLLKKLLESSLENKGEGAYLQLMGIEVDEASLIFKIGGELLRTNQNYLIGMNAFLLEGYDFSFFTKDNEGIIKVIEPGQDDLLKKDLRKAMIEYLKKKK
ncbi:MAG: bifunctional UDP-sugar hydrolase/5'-nucleotidase [Saprospiraceae bacterium]